MTDWISPVDRARLAGQDPLTRLDELETLARRSQASTVTLASLTEASGDTGFVRSGGTFFGSGDPNDLSTLATGTWIEDQLGIHIFNNGTEVARFGNLNTFLDYVTATYGIAIGSLTSGFLSYDTAQGLRLKGVLAVFGIFPLGYDAWDEDVIGTPNSSIVNFATVNQYASGTLQVIQNGIWLRAGGNDYSEGSANTLYMNIVPQTGDILRCNYIKASDLTVVYNETPTGAVNGTNTTYTTANNHVPGSLQVFLNGVTLDFDDDFLDGSRTFIMTRSPQTGDQLVTAYKAAADAKLIRQEIPTGLINGSNTVFTLANNYVAGTPIVVLNGVKQTLTSDYTESGANQLTMTFAPSTGDLLWVTYRMP